jgi:hypothetical protein
MKPEERLAALNFAVNQASKTALNDYSQIQKEFKQSKY